MPGKRQSTLSIFRQISQKGNEDKEHTRANLTELSSILSSHTDPLTSRSSSMRPSETIAAVHHTLCTTLSVVSPAKYLSGSRNSGLHSTITRRRSIPYCMTPHRAVSLLSMDSNINTFRRPNSVGTGGYSRHTMGMCSKPKKSCPGIVSMWKMLRIRSEKWGIRIL